MVAAVKGKIIGRLGVAALTVAIVSCSGPSSYNRWPERVSLIRLLAEPSEFDGHKIQVAGYLIFGQEDHAIYFSPDDARNGISNGGIELNFYNSPFSPLAPRRFDRKYVSIVGVFHSNGVSQWPAKFQTNTHVFLLTNIENIRTPPYVYGPRGKVSEQDQLP